MSKYGSRIIEKKEYVMMKQFQNMKRYTSKQGEETESSDLEGCISTAIIYDLAEIPRDVVRLYSKVKISTDGGWSKEFQLVLPSEVHSLKGVISLDSAIGVAVMGLAEGDYTNYLLMGGVVAIKIEKVLQDERTSETRGRNHFFKHSVNKLA